MSEPARSVTHARVAARYARSREEGGYPGSTREAESDVAGADVASGEPVRLAVERYRTRPIGTDDTAVLRLTLRGGPPVVVAVTLAGEDFIAGEITVTGTRGSATLEYPTDRLRLPGEAEPRRLSRHSYALRLLQYVRDEAHRFAQHYHHLLRRKSTFDETMRK